MSRDPDARREWLWIRALEKDDVESRTALKRSDPGVAERVREFMECQAHAAPRELLHDHRAYHGWLLDRFLDDYGGLTALPCGCPACLALADP